MYQYQTVPSFHRRNKLPDTTHTRSFIWRFDTAACCWSSAAVWAERALTERSLDAWLSKFFLASSADHTLLRGAASRIPCSSIKIKVFALPEADAVRVFCSYLVAYNLILDYMGECDDVSVRVFRHSWAFFGLCKVQIKETPDTRQETRDGRWQTRDRRQKTRDIGNTQQETRDARRQT